MPKVKKKGKKIPPNRSSEHMREIGRRGGLRTAKKKGKAYFRRIAKLSHPVNNPNAKRENYNGGRRPSSEK